MHKNGLLWAAAMMVAISLSPSVAAETNNIAELRKRAIEMQRNGLAEIDQGHDLKAKNLFDQSIACIDKCLVVEPNSPTLLADKANVLQDKGILQSQRSEPDSASRAFKDCFDLYTIALAKSPDNVVQYQIELAKTQYKIANLQLNFFSPRWAWHNFDASIKSLDDVLTKSPNNFAAWREKGNALVAEGRALTVSSRCVEALAAVKYAQAAYAKALKINPTDRNTLYAVAQSYAAEANCRYRQPHIESGRRSLLQVVKICDTILKSWPSDISILQCRAEAFKDIAGLKSKHRRQRILFLTKASQDYEKLTKLAPDNYWFYERRASLEYSQAQLTGGKSAVRAYAEVVEADNQCLRLEPADGKRVLARAVALYQQGCSASEADDKPQAKILLHKAIDASQDRLNNQQLKDVGWEKEAMLLQYRACYELALIYAGENNYQSAIESISEAVTGYESSKKSNRFYRMPYLRQGLALWTKARWELAMGDREAAAISLVQASKAFNFCMAKQPSSVIARYGRGNLIIDSKTLQAQMSQGSRKPISYATAKKAINKQLAKDDYLLRHGI